jgi:hypothetical protein
MTDLIPYFAGFITLLFSAGFISALMIGKKINNEK